MAGSDFLAAAAATDPQMRQFFADKARTALAAAVKAPVPGVPGAGVRLLGEAYRQDAEAKPTDSLPPRIFGSPWSPI